MTRESDRQVDLESVRRALARVADPDIITADSFVQLLLVNRGDHKVYQYGRVERLGSALELMFAPANLRIPLDARAAMVRWSDGRRYAVLLEQLEPRTRTEFGGFQ